MNLPTTLPKRTPQLDKFESALAKLNQFYWSFICSFDVAEKAASRTGVRRTADFVPTAHWKQLDITAAEFIGLRGEVVTLARFNLIILAITYFEDYLTGVLQAYLLTRLDPTKRYPLNISLGELPTRDGAAFIEERMALELASSIVNSAYGERTKRIKALLDKYGTGQNIDVTMPDDSLVVAAHEVRNCIVHSAGVADERAVVRLKSVFTGLKRGDHLQLDDAIFRKLLGAVRDAALSVDVAVRVRPSSTPQKKRPRKS